MPAATLTGVAMVTVLVARALLAASLVSSAVVPDKAESAMSSDISVKVRVNITEHLIKVTCEAVGIKDPEDASKIQVFCPARRGSQCFDDCSPMCSMQSDGSCVVTDAVLQEPHVTCSKASLAPGSKTIELLVDTRARKLAGSWFCKFRGESGAEVTLNHYVPPPSPPMATAAPPGAAGGTSSPPAGSAAEVPGGGETKLPPVPGGKDSRATDEPPGSNGSPEPGGKTDSGLPNGPSFDDTIAQFARADFVIGVPALLCASLMVNLAFCIRCCLAKYYVSLRRRKQQPPGCLAHCLCVSTVQVVEKPAGGAGAAEDTYEEVLPRAARGGGPQRASLRSMETTYIEHSSGLGMHRSRTMPPPGAANTQASLYYLQGVSDSMSRILYDDVPAHDASRSSSRQGSRPSSPYGQLLVSGRNSRSRGSLRGLNKSAGVAAAVATGAAAGNCVPAAVPEEAAPFVPSSPTTAEGAPKAANEAMDSDEEAGSDYSGATRLELSRLMLRKADTLLREANSLLRDTAQGGEAEEAAGLHTAD